MNSSFAMLRAKAARYAVCAGLSAVFTACAAAQKPETRIVAPIDNLVRTTLQNSHSSLATAANDAGQMPVSTQLQGVSICLSKTAAQQAAIDSLIAAQQNPASPQYHQWLSPDEYAAQFGASDADLSKVQGWLQQQGFSVLGVSRDRSTITFTGNVAQIEAAFGAEMHYFNVEGKKHFAPATDLSVPAAFAPAIAGVGNLSDFRPKPNVKQGAPVKVDFTSSQTGSHFVTPKDLATIYDINASYNTGWTGAGQTIAVIGESAILASDITNFQTAAGTPVRAPNLILVPNTGTSTLYTDDEGESDLDVEYSGAVARGATVDFVYTGNSANYDVYDALGYAVTNKIGTIITISYGTCEPAFASSFAKYDAYLQQASLQGQSVIASSGDSGSTGCYEDQGQTGVTTAAQTALNVSWPGSSAYVTSMGGTEFLTADVAASNSTYWVASTGSDVISSATQYIPEMVWNDDSTSGGLSASGGGISTDSLHPSWQTGVAGINASAYRLVPDIALASSPNNAGYLYCSSDTSTGITGSCTNGFRDATNTYLTVAGGTSFAAPVFAGMLAIINQSKGATTGQGLVNPTLYTLAANATTYALAFHDITSGNNGCTAGLTYPFSLGNSTTAGPACPTSSAGTYAAATGYDLATGLGSVDVNNLLTAWPGTTAATPSTFTLSASTTAITQGNSGVETITLTPVKGYTGTVNLALSINPLIVGGCFTATSGTIAGTSAATATATIYTSSASCPAGAVSLVKAGTAQASLSRPATPGRSELPPGVAMAGLLALGFVGQRSRRLRGAVTVALLAVVAGFGLSGCGSTSTAGQGITGSTTSTSTTSTGTAAKGTYTISVTGTDSVTGATASTSFALTIQ